MDWSRMFEVNVSSVRDSLKWGKISIPNLMSVVSKSQYLNCFYNILLFLLSLQRFKINVANTVINQDNNSLASMGTNQLLDLFTVDRSTVSEKQSTRTDSDNTSTSTQPAKQSLRTILDGLDDLWDNKDYETEYNVNSFLSSLKNCE